MTKPLISIVTPCYQEESNVELHYQRVMQAIMPYTDCYNFEHIYTDNCSTDQTFSTLVNMAEGNANLKILRFSRNIGANRAIYQGMIRAKGDAVILIQADLQDPPELIPEFIKYWEQGYDVAFGQILDREESWLLKKMRVLYYQMVSSLAEVQPHKNAGEFRIISKRVSDAIKLYSEDDIYLRGVISHIGFKQIGIPYRRAARERGQTSTNFLFLVGYALNGITSTSVAPLRAVTVSGLIISVTGFALGMHTAIYKFMFPESIPHGISTIAILITFFSGVQILTLGIIGEYIRKIFVQSLNRPQAIIMDQVNL